MYFFKNFKHAWLGALLNYECWFCAFANRLIIWGFLVVCALACLGFFVLTCWALLLIVFTLVALVVIPYKVIEIQAQDKKIVVSVFQTDFDHLYRRNNKRKRFFLRSLAFYPDKTKETIFNETEILGFDDALRHLGIFLFKAIPSLGFAKNTPSLWFAISDEYPQGTILGTKIGNFVFEKKLDEKSSSLCFCLKNGLYFKKVTSVIKRPHITYEPSSASFLFLADLTPARDVSPKDLQYLLTKSDNKQFLIAYCWVDNEPRAYIVISPAFIYKTRNIENLYKTDDFGVISSIA